MRGERSLVNLMLKAEVRFVFTGGLDLWLKVHYLCSSWLFDRLAFWGIFLLPPTPH